jgi:hypothetical protein
LVFRGLVIGAVTGASAGYLITEFLIQTAPPGVGHGPVYAGLGLFICSGFFGLFFGALVGLW